MLKINKLLIKNKLKLTSSYFCFLKVFKQDFFFYSNNKTFFYKYGNILVFFIEKLIFQLLKVLYLSFDILKKNGVFLLLIAPLFGGFPFKNTQVYVLSDWFPGTFSNKLIVWWTYFKCNLPLMLEKPAVAFFFKTNVSDYNIALELRKYNIPIVAPISNSNFDISIDYPLYFNKSLYSLYFFFCLLLKLLCIK